MQGGKATQRYFLAIDELEEYAPPSSCLRKCTGVAPGSLLLASEHGDGRVSGGASQDKRPSLQNIRGNMVPLGRFFLALVILLTNPADLPSIGVRFLSGIKLEGQQHLN